MEGKGRSHQERFLRRSALARSPSEEGSFLETKEETSRDRGRGEERLGVRRGACSTPYWMVGEGGASEGGKKVVAGSWNLAELILTPC